MNRCLNQDAQDERNNRIRISRMEIKKTEYRKYNTINYESYIIDIQEITE
jgi:hypothetical protein